MQCLTAHLHPAGAEVLGISGDSPEANAAFAKAQRLPFPLLSDEGNAFRKDLGIKGDMFGLIPGRQVGRPLSCAAHKSCSLGVFPMSTNSSALWRVHKALMPVNHQHEGKCKGKCKGMHQAEC